MVIDEMNIDLGRAALVVIDMQNDFVLETGTGCIPGSFEILANVVRLLKAFRACQRPIVHVLRLYHRSGDNAELGRRTLIARGPSLVAPNTYGSLPVQGLLPDGAAPIDPQRLMSGALQEFSSNEWAMYKPRWGAFYRTSLEEHLRALNVGAVIVCGCNLPNCPRATAFEASERDFEVAVVSDATSQASETRLADLRLIDVAVVSTAAIEFNLLPASPQVMSRNNR